MKLNRAQIRQIIYESLSEQNISNPDAVKPGDVVGDTSVNIKFGDQKFEVNIALLKNQKGKMKGNEEFDQAFSFQVFDPSKNPVAIVAFGNLPYKAPKTDK